MADIGYPDDSAAQRAFDPTVVLQCGLILELASAARVSRREDGIRDVVTPAGATATGAAGSALWGKPLPPAADRPAPRQRVPPWTGPRRIPLSRRARQTGELWPSA
jgi:hypothetical protein